MIVGELLTNCLQTLINSMENYNEIGLVIEGQVFGKPSKIFFDTGAKVNIISLKRLRELIPGVVVLEPTKYIIQGVTGNKINALGEIEIPVLLTSTFWLDIKAVVVEESTFPDLLTGYETIKEDEIALFPASSRSSQNNTTWTPHII